MRGGGRKTGEMRTNGRGGKEDEKYRDEEEGGR